MNESIFLLYAKLIFDAKQEVFWSQIYNTPMADAYTAVVPN